MIICPSCGVVLADDTAFCPACGKPLGDPQINGTAPSCAPGYGTSGYTPPAVDPYDHTSEFEAQDISENKVICMLIYLGGFVGILVALLMSNSSKYVAFHVRQALKFEVVTILLSIVTALASLLTAVVRFFVFLPVLCVILTLVLVGLRVVCFFQICAGKAKEPLLIRSLSFLK